MYDFDRSRGAPRARAELVSAELLILGYTLAFAVALLALVHAPRRDHVAPVFGICALLPLAALAHYIDHVAPSSPAARLLFVAGWPAVPLALLVARPRALLAALGTLIIYGVLVALLGGPWWPWPLRAPRLVVGVLATAIALRRASPPTLRERVGLYLAAGQVAGVLAGAWGQWANMRAVSAVIVTIAVADLACASLRA